VGTGVGRVGQGGTVQAVDASLVLLQIKVGVEVKGVLERVVDEAEFKWCHSIEEKLIASVHSGSVDPEDA
jgi:hypothetical protein